MNKTLKWVLIFLGIALLVFCLALPLFLAPAMRGGFSGRMPMMGRDFGPFNNYGGHMRFGGGLFGIGFMLLRLIIPLGVLALAVVGVVALVRGRKPAQPPAAPIAAAPVEPAPAAAAPVEHPCPHCGQPVQDGWLACPHCGEKL